MSNRDWLDVASSEMRRWYVYGIIDRSWRTVLYIGITNQSVPERVAQHRADPSSAMYGWIEYLNCRGDDIDYCVFAEVQSEAAARHLENALIAILPLILNRTGVREQIGFWRPFAHALPIELG